ncbi:hypothetical protein FRB94_002816 [Tulasnella sp. JGI-2019a]|nr:hypothetical protein FRB94_002816 [Tulasnella sp. JGI-2019a]
MTASSSPSAPRAKPWKHLVSGGLGGMGGALVTAPLDVVKTRLQSSIYQDVIRQERLAAQLSGGAEVVVRRPGGLLYNFVETGHILRDLYKLEGPSALFRGLGPTLVGVIPARSINFFTYGNGKLYIADTFNGGKENSAVHLSAAVFAGLTTSTATNPIWVVKTRLQLMSDKRPIPGSVAPTAQLRSQFFRSFHVTMDIVKRQGVRGLYKGLSASYLGVTEGTIQWVLYERLKARVAGKGGAAEWAGMLGAAGTAKMTASLITYPHEVIRTRLRQDPPMVNGVLKPKYTGLLQTLRLVIAEEGAAALYGGLSAHLLRVIPNAAIMYTIYETFIRYF